MLLSTTGGEAEAGARFLELGGSDFIRAGAGDAGGLLGDDIGIEGAQEGGGEFGESLAAGELGELRAALGRDGAVEPGEAAGEGGERVFAAIAERDLLEHFLQPDGGQALQRTRLGLVAVADADGIDDDEVTARNLLFTAPRRKRVGRRAVPGSEGV